MKALKVNPIVLIIINIIAPSMYIFLNGKFLMFYLLAFSTLLLLFMGNFKRILALFLIFWGMYGVYSLSMYTGKFQGIGLFLIVLVQSVPCLILASVLISKYTSAQLLAALETMHIPRIIVVAVTITLKYLPTFKREFSYIKDSMRLRGIDFTLLHPIRSFKFFVVPQLFRCSTLAEEVTAAGMVKGIDAPIRRTSFYEDKIRLTDIAILLVFVIGLAGGFVWKMKLL